MKLFYWLTGGRPMTIIRQLFVDVVVNKDVYIVQDKFGRKWLAHGKWSLFRVRYNREDV